MSALTPDARHEYYVELANGLPPTICGTDSYQQRRFTTAVAVFEALRPADAYEGRLAVQIVLSGAHAAEIMREAGFLRDDFAKLTRCRAQAAGMMRAGASAKRTLEREQKMRWAMEAMARGEPAQSAVAAGVPPTADASAAPPAPAMAVSSPAAHASPPQAAQEPAAAPLLPPAIAPLRLVATSAVAPLAQAGSAPPPSPEAIDKAEEFMAEHLEAALRIRHDRGVTPQAKALFRNVRMPTDPAVIDLLVRGTSPLLNLLNDFGAEALDAAD